ncbi:MAG: DnaJ domain-containing protein [Polyangiaceae bacterium]|nr:DnaJ domain-containing protein [Polyangiaceae bacterium]
MPQPVVGLDLRSLHLGPEEAFVFSRIDGTSTDADIQAATGLPSTVVASSLERLLALGAIRFDGNSQPAPEPFEPARPPTSDAQDGTDLDAARRELIVKTHSQLAELDHYALLGVDPTADRKAIKATYYKVASVFHPDRYYGKNLGSYKAKLETIFERFTQAERVLSDPKARADYDSYLARQRRTRDLEQALGAPKDTTAPPVAPPSEHASAQPVSAQSSSLAPALAGRATPQPVQPFSSPPSEQRKRALARKLLGGGSPSGSRSQQMPAVQPSDGPSRSGHDELRRLYEQRSHASRDAKVEERLSAAGAALQDKQPVVAAAELRAAESLGATDPQLIARIESFRRRLAEEMADSYLEQARYEERAGRLTDAAVSYQKAAEGRPSAPPYCAAARCLLESGGDLRRAADLARKAVGLAPEDAQIRFVLARVFMAAGMRTSALNALEQASGLAPDDTNIRNWLRRLRRGDA